MTVRVAINGFGRIGRQVFKIIHQRYLDELRITHIGVSNPHATENRALLLKYDSNYGVFGAAVESPLQGILGYSPLPLVSSDFQGMTYSSVLDALSTMTMGDMIKVVAWYDNEWGYACRVAELAHYLVEQGI
jgi:glyceraldehyde-3-phosphate dehydrogenase/erythrose-4-phosphate dehydrogenase